MESVAHVWNRIVRFSIEYLTQSYFGSVFNHEIYKTSICHNLDAYSRTWGGIFPSTSFRGTGLRPRGSTLPPLYNNSTSSGENRQFIREKVIAPFWAKHHRFQKSPQSEPELRLPSSLFCCEDTGV